MPTNIRHSLKPELQTKLDGSVAHNRKCIPGRPKSLHACIHGSTEVINNLYNASRPHKHFKIDFTPKLSSQQHVKYGSNLMNIFFISFPFLGGPGEAYDESRGTNVS